MELLAPGAFDPPAIALFRLTSPRMKRNVVTATITGDSSLTRISKRTAWLAALSATLFGLSNTFTTALADETCSSPYLARIEGQEEFVYVWTLGSEGLGDGREFSRSGSRDFMNRGISRAGESRRSAT